MLHRGRALLRRVPFTGRERILSDVPTQLTRLLQALNMRALVAGPRPHGLCQHGMSLSAYDQSVGARWPHQ